MTFSNSHKKIFQKIKFINYHFHMELLNNFLFIQKKEKKKEKEKKTTLSLWQPKFILETNQNLKATYQNLKAKIN